MRADTAEEAVRAVEHPEVDVCLCHDDLEVPQKAGVWFERPGGGMSDPDEGADGHDGTVRAPITDRHLCASMRLGPLRQGARDERRHPPSSRFGRSSEARPGPLPP